jgi:hypothetical protein
MVLTNLNNVDVDFPIPAPLSPEPPLQPDLPQVTQTGRPRRNYTLPKRYRDLLPEAPIPAAEAQEVAQDMPLQVPQRLTLALRPFRTAWNFFRLCREFLCRPSHDPDSVVAHEDLAQPLLNRLSLDIPVVDCHLRTSSGKQSKTTMLLLGWQNTGSSQKSNGEIDDLVHKVILHPAFNPADLIGFRAQRENRRSEPAKSDPSLPDSFRETTVQIDIPSGEKGTPSKFFSIPGLHYRPLTSIIRASFTSPSACKLHFTPYKNFRRSLGNRDERVRSELYDSDAFIDEHEKIQKLELPPDDPNCKRERAVAAMMLWSDSTHLANFGTAKLWPIYLFLGNLSKYSRTQPSSSACQHVAYIPSLPDHIQDFISTFHRKWSTQKKDILTHCRRELMHAVWRILLDDEFVHAYKYGIVLKCFDGIERRMYPRVLTYSADYPEK